MIPQTYDELSLWEVIITGAYCAFLMVAMFPVLLFTAAVFALAFGPRAVVERMKK